MKATAKKIVISKYFRHFLTFLGILFIIITYFITVKPDSFLQFGYVGIFLFNAVSSGLLLMPTLTPKMNLFLLVFASALGNIPNTAINYLIGSSSRRLFSGNSYVGLLKRFINRFGLFAVYILAILPLPLDLNGLLAGYMEIPFKKYILVNFLGKITIFFLVGLGVISFAVITR